MVFMAPNNSFCPVKLCYHYGNVLILYATNKVVLNVVLSKPGFERYYTFQDGLKVEELKDAVKNISSCVFI
jgi:hypothetical protein